MTMPDVLPDQRPNDAIPDASARHDALTPERQVAFLEALAATGSVSAAAEAIGASRTALYNLRHRAEGAAFRESWDTALKQAVAVLAETAFERAVHGVREPVWYKGEQVGERVRHNDRLLMGLLRALDPETYAPRPAPRPQPARPQAAAPARMTVPRPAMSAQPPRPAVKYPAPVSTLSTSVSDDDEIALEPQQKAALRAVACVVQGEPPPPEPLSKRNARRLAARRRISNRR